MGEGDLNKGGWVGLDLSGDGALDQDSRRLGKDVRWEWSFFTVRVEDAALAAVRASPVVPLSHPSSP